MRKADLKSTTVESFANRENTGKIFPVTENPEPDISRLFKNNTATPKTVDPVTTEDNIRRQYNDNIKNLDSRYTAIRPLNGIIVRICLRVSETIGEFIVPSMGKVTTTHKSGITKHSLTDPFRFSSMAVVVSKPDHIDVIEVGQLVQISVPKIMATHEMVVGYDYEYAHPSYNREMLPTNPEDEHFGYAMVPLTFIKAIIE